MSKIKKKLNVIRPTLRHRKRYFLLTFTKEFSLNTKIHSLFLKNFEKIHGLFSLIECNLTVMDFNFENKTVVIRINNNYRSLFLSSLFFLKDDFGLISILKEASTLKSLK